MMTEEELLKKMGEMDREELLKALGIAKDQDKLKAYNMLHVANWMRNAVEYMIQCMENGNWMGVLTAQGSIAGMLEPSGLVSATTANLTALYYGGSEEALGAATDERMTLETKTFNTFIRDRTPRFQDRD
jgi:hypothetical protein